MKKIRRILRVILGIAFPAIFMPMSIIGFAEGRAPIGILFLLLTASSGASLWWRLRRDKLKQKEGEAHGAEKADAGGAPGD